MSGTERVAEMGTCEKCASEISTNADRCPQCGYEPANHGILLSIIAALTTMGAVLLSGFIVIVWIAALATEFTLTGAVSITLFSLFLMLPLALVGYGLLNKERKTPTGENKSWDEVFNRGGESS